MANADMPIYAQQMPRIVARDGLRVREDVLYTDGKGAENDRSRKRAEEVLSKLKDILPVVLEPNETVIYVIKNCQAPMSALEQFLLGWQAVRVTPTNLVFTNARLLHFGVDTKGNWKRIIKSVRWGDIQEAKTRGLLSKMLQLKYGSGKKESYWRVPGKDAKKAKDVLAAVLSASRGEATAAQGMVSICPDCRTVLTAGMYRCSQCGLIFKDDATLLKRTLLIPGGGYLYAGMTFLGVATFLGEGAFTLGALYYALMGAGILAAIPEENGRVMTRSEMWVAAVFLAVLIGLNKGLEYAHSRRVIRMFIPVKRPGQN